MVCSCKLFDVMFRDPIISSSRNMILQGNTSTKQTNLTNTLQLVGWHLDIVSPLRMNLIKLWLHIELLHVFSLDVILHHFVLEWNTSEQITLKQLFCHSMKQRKLMVKTPLSSTKLELFITNSMSKKVL
jgi:hypothetical protein